MDREPRAGVVGFWRRSRSLRGLRTRGTPSQTSPTSATRPLFALYLLYLMHVAASGEEVIFFCGYQGGLTGGEGIRTASDNSTGSSFSPCASLPGLDGWDANCVPERRQGQNPGEWSLVCVPGTLTRV